MKATVLYSVVRGSMRVRINIFRHPSPPGVYDSGIRVAKENFDYSKQICGDPQVQLYMNKATAFIVDSFRPGATPQTLWDGFLQSEVSKKIHSLKDAFNYYLMEAVIEKSTHKDVTAMIARVEATGLLYTDLRDMTPAIILKLVRDISVGCSESTTYMRLSRLKAVLNRYNQDHRLKLDLELGRIMKAPKKRTAARGEEPFLTLDEVTNLIKLDLSHSKHLAYGRDLFCLMAFTGMAVGDLVKFTPDMVDADSFLTYSRTKNDNPCEIPLIAQAKEIIARHKWPVKLDKRTIQHHCSLLSKIIGKRITPHTARHSFGCIALELGFSMESVSKMMGHSTIKTTETIYAKVTRDKIQREMRELPIGMKNLMSQPLV